MVAQRWLNGGGGSTVAQRLLNDGSIVALTVAQRRLNGCSTVAQWWLNGGPTVAHWWLSGGSLVAQWWLSGGSM
eukprot:11034904-Lingulodinium_polyedra.AAC.1